MNNIVCPNCGKSDTWVPGNTMESDYLCSACGHKWWRTTATVAPTSGDEWTQLPGGAATRHRGKGSILEALKAGADADKPDVAKLLTDENFDASLEGITKRWSDAHWDWSVNSDGEAEVWAAKDHCVCWTGDIEDERATEDAQKVAYAPADIRYLLGLLKFERDASATLLAKLEQVTALYNVLMNEQSEALQAKVKHLQSARPAPNGGATAGVAPELGPQEPPNDPMIFNRKQSDGTYRQASEFFDKAIEIADRAPEPPATARKLTAFEREITIGELRGYAPSGESAVSWAEEQKTHRAKLTLYEAKLLRKLGDGWKLKPRLFSNGYTVQKGDTVPHGVSANVVQGLRDKGYIQPTGGDLTPAGVAALASESEAGK